MEEITEEVNNLRNKWFLETKEKAYTGIINDNNSVIFKNDYVHWLEEKLIFTEIIKNIHKELRLSNTSNFYNENNPISDEIYLVLEEMDIETMGAVTTYLNTINPKLSICPKCHVDNFVHIDNCEFYKRWNPDNK